MKWPPWAYGVAGAGYALAAGFTAIYAAPCFMGPPELELDDPTHSPAVLDVHADTWLTFDSLATTAHSALPPAKCREGSAGEQDPLAARRALLAVPMQES